LFAGCGDDESSSSKSPTKRSARKKSRSKKSGKVTKVRQFDKLEDLYDSEQVSSMRRSSAYYESTQRRDPFRSYIVRQDMWSSKSSEAKEQAETASAEMGCDHQRMAAPNPSSLDPAARKSYSLRDLHLMAIINKGTKGYAMFVDRTGYGHIVKRGYCLATEKAEVKEIGTGFVVLEIPNADGKEKQTKTIKLHKEDVEFDFQRNPNRIPRGLPTRGRPI